MTSILAFAMNYLDRGWASVAYAFKTKGPKTEDWQDDPITELNVRDRCNGGAQNIGLIMGGRSRGLTDVDLASPEAVAVAPYLLPATKAIFGRASKRGSHLLYYSNLASKIDSAAKQFQDPDKKTDKKVMLVELRIGGGGKAAQTMA